MKVIPSGAALGASVEGLNLARPLQPAELDSVLKTLGKHGVVRFPRQELTGRELRDFSRQLGDLEINVASHAYQEPGVPEVMILSNIVENGKPIGLADAGQGWHTDMSYSRMIAFAKVLYANPGYAVRINELAEKESDELLEFLFEHQLKPKYIYTSRWEEGDVLVWEDIGTIHNAVADYGPDEHRFVKRCQVMANRYFREDEL